MISPHFFASATVLMNPFSVNTVGEKYFTPYSTDSSGSVIHPKLPQLLHMLREMRTKYIKKTTRVFENL